MAAILRVVPWRPGRRAGLGAHALTQGAQRPPADWGSSGELHKFPRAGQRAPARRRGRQRRRAERAPTASCSSTPAWPQHAEKVLAPCNASCPTSRSAGSSTPTRTTDHTGGNEVIGKAGSTTDGNPTPIVAHENVLTRMSLPGGGQAARPTAAWPTSTYLTGHEGLLLQRRAGVVYHVNDRAHRRRFGGVLPPLRRRHGRRPLSDHHLSAHRPRHWRRRAGADRRV